MGSGFSDNKQLNLSHFHIYQAIGKGGFGKADDMEASSNKRQQSRARTPAGISGLGFGASRRVLPWEVEALVYESFLPADALLSLFFVSKSMSAAVIRFLRKCKHWKWQESRDKHNEAAVAAAVAQRSLMFALTAKHCRALRVIEVSVPPTTVREYELWQVRVLTLNRASITRVETSTPSPLQNVRGSFDMKHRVEHADLAQALVLCPSIEDLHISDYCFSDTAPVLAQLATLPLTKLRSLRLIALRLPREQLMAILKRGLPLTCLDLYVTKVGEPLSLDIVRALLLPSYSRLQELRLYDTLFLSVDLAELLSRVFIGMPSLQKLALSLGRQPGALRQQDSAEAVGRVRWRLPALRELVFRSFAALGPIPTVEAPQLTSLTVCEIAHADVIPALLRCCQSSPKLQTINVDESQPGQDNNWQSGLPSTGPEFWKSFASGAWPQRNELCWLPCSDSEFHAATALIAQPLSTLRRLDVALPSPAAVRALLLRFPDLTDLIARCPDADTYGSQISGAPDVNRADSKSSALPGVHHMQQLELSVADDSIFQAFRFESLRALTLSGRFGYVSLRSFDALLLACPVLEELNIYGLIEVRDWKANASTRSKVRKLTIELGEINFQEEDPDPGPLAAENIVALAPALPLLEELYVRSPLTRVCNVNELAELLELSTETLFPALTTLQIWQVTGGVHVPSQQQLSLDLAKRLFTRLPSLSFLRVNEMSDELCDALELWLRGLGRVLRDFTHVLL